MFIQFGHWIGSPIFGVMFILAGFVSTQLRGLDSLQTSESRKCPQVGAGESDHRVAGSDLRFPNAKSDQDNKVAGAFLHKILRQRVLCCQFQKGLEPTRIESSWQQKNDYWIFKECISLPTCNKNDWQEKNYYKKNAFSAWSIEASLLEVTWEGNPKGRQRRRRVEEASWQTYRWWYGSNHIVWDRNVL